MNVAPSGIVSVTFTCGAIKAVELFEIVRTYVADVSNVADAGPLIVIDMSGACAGGGAAGITGAEGADSALSPIAFVAWTVNVYAVPFVRPVTLAPVDVPATVTTIPDGTPPTSAVTV